MSSIHEFSRFQLEATKLGRNIVFQVTVFEKKERGKSRLFAETQCSDALHYIIQFVIRDAPDLDGVLERFKAQLVHRGFAPVAVRTKKTNGAWAAWQDVDEAVAS